MWLESVVSSVAVRKIQINYIFHFHNPVRELRPLTEENGSFTTEA